jgi:hypothetical protein
MRTKPGVLSSERRCRWWRCDVGSRTSGAAAIVDDRRPGASSERVGGGGGDDDHDDGGGDRWCRCWGEVLATGGRSDGAGRGGEGTPRDCALVFLARERAGTVPSTEKGQTGTRARHTWAPSRQLRRCGCRKWAGCEQNASNYWYGRLHSTFVKAELSTLRIY